MLIGIYIKKDQGVILYATSKKISIVIKTVNGSADTLMHKAEHPSNYFSDSFTHNVTEQIKKGVICVQTLLKIHLTEQGRFYFQGCSTF